MLRQLVSTVCCTVSDIGFSPVFWMISATRRRLDPNVIPASAVVIASGLALIRGRHGRRLPRHSKPFLSRLSLFFIEGNISHTRHRSKRCANSRIITLPLGVGTSEQGTKINTTDLVTTPWRRILLRDLIRNHCELQILLASKSILRSNLSQTSRHTG